MADADVRVPLTRDNEPGSNVDCDSIVRDGVTYYRQRVLASIVGAQIGTATKVNSLGRLVVTEVTRLVGSLFETTTKDVQQWQEAVVGTGAATQAQGEILLTTGTTADSSITYSTVEHARFVSGTVNAFKFVGFLVTGGTANNERRVGVGEWTTHSPTGAETPNNGYGFYINGTEFGIWYRSLSQNPSGIVRVPSGSFSTGKTYTPTLTSVVKLEIEYEHGGVNYFINGEHYHTQTPTTDILSDTMNFHAFAQNINSGGATANVSLMIHVLSISRYGQMSTTPTTRRISGLGTTILKTGPGAVHTIINAVKVVASTVTVWDGLTAAAPSRQILTIDAANFQGVLDFHSTFRDGLTISTDKAGDDLTIIYE